MRCGRRQWKLAPVVGGLWALLSLVPLPGAGGELAQWVNGGSNTGLFGYDWKTAGVCGLNLAGSPQSMRRDMEKIRAHRGEIADGAYVVFTLCPFTSVLTEAYDRRPSASTHALLDFDGQPDAAALEGFRRQLIDGWKGEFAIRDFADPMTEANRAAYRKMVAFARASVAWCRRERLVPVFVLPPAAKCFDDVFPDGFVRAYVADFVRDVGGDVPFFNYWRSLEFRDDRLFANALFLNKSGRIRLTARTIADIRRHFGQK